jgi:Na+/H+ antiporter NhaD/arsenite permease-like protein
MPHLLPAIAACVIFLGAYVLIATEKWVTRTAAALGGAALVLALGISDAEAPSTPRRPASTGTSSSCSSA